MAPPKESPLRNQAREGFRAGLDAAEPARAVRAALAFEGGQLRIGGWVILPTPRRVRVVAFGKAACAMASTAAEVLPPALFPGPGLAVTSRGSARPVTRFQVLEAGHPLPDGGSAAAARAVEDALHDAAHDELALVLISGGGSALVAAPAPPLALEDKVETTRLLLSAGADIRELNTVRKHLSRLKGGGLARAASPAAVRALILSDVIGNDLSVIASGPVSPDPSTFAEALSILEKRGVLSRMPRAARERLRAGARGELPETPKPGDPVFQRVECAIVGSNRTSFEAAVRRTGELGYPVMIEELSGEAREAARRLVSRAHIECQKLLKIALVLGGETTVTVRGPGRGGRSQELALAFALEMESARIPGEWVFLAAGTDGIDGPTDAAGGVVDAGTLDRIRRRGIDPRAALEANDSYTALDASGDLIRIGPTGTNVADLAVFLWRSGGAWFRKPSSSPPARRGPERAARSRRVP